MKNSPIFPGKLFAQGWHMLRKELKMLHALTDGWLCTKRKRRPWQDCKLPGWVLKAFWNQWWCLHNTECTESHWTEHFNMINAMLYELYKRDLRRFWEKRERKGVWRKREMSNKSSTSEELPIKNLCLAPRDHSFL